MTTLSLRNSKGQTCETQLDQLQYIDIVSYTTPSNKGCGLQNYILMLELIGLSFSIHTPFRRLPISTEDKENKLAANQRVWSSVVPSFLVGGEKKSLISTMHACA